MTNPLEELEITVKEKTNQFISDMEVPDKRAELLKDVPGHVKFALDPELYAKGAIKCLEDQLTRVRSAKRKRTLERRLADWKQRLEVLSNVE